MEPKLIILRGNSGSGKTTLAKRLQEKLGPNTMRISHDMIRMEILHTWGKEGVEKSEPLMIELLKYGRRHSEVTILEGILPSEAYGRLFEAAIEQFGKNIFAYYYDLPFEETLRRHATKSNRDEFGEADMRRWWVEKDYLHNIQETVFGQKLSQDDALTRVCRDIAAE